MRPLLALILQFVATLILSSVAAAVPANQPAESLTERGKYLADAGNCYSCHTLPGAAPLSGGVPFVTPFGTIYSTNITSDRATGIGSWTAGDLRRAMREGIAVDERRLYPAFPYPAFTKVSDADIEAIYAYLRTVKAAYYIVPKNGFLFSQRWMLGLWNILFFTEGRFVPSTTQSSEWNRGAYLVEGLAHCGACHTPRSRFMAEQADKAYEGGVLQAPVAPGKIRTWSAVNLTSAKSGLAAWSISDLVKYLQTGFSPRAGSFGPMNEVIANSLRRLRSDDIHAMAVYIKSLPAARERDSEEVPREEVQAGQVTYKDHCEKCHLASGRGGMFSAPPLAGSAVVLADNPASLINVILYGPHSPPGVLSGSWETMEPYKDVLDDAQVTAVCNYVRSSWRHHAAAVTRANVAEQR